MKAMEHKIVRFSPEETDAAVRRYFAQYSGITAGTPKQERMQRRAEAVFAAMAAGIRLQAVYSLEPAVWEGRERPALRLSDRTFSCRAFERVDTSRLPLAIPYVLTAGDCRSEMEAVLDLVYEDLWGTALVDAGREALGEHLGRSLAGAPGGLRLSPSFGPGYFGMPLEAIGSIAGLLPTEAIEVRINRGGMLIPQKSCAGIFLAGAAEAAELPVACASCGLGDSTAGCRYCRIRDGGRGIPSV